MKRRFVRSLRKASADPVRCLDSLSSNTAMWAGVPGVVLQAGVAGDRADDGDPEPLLHSGRGADPPVELAADDRVAEPEQEAEHQPEEHVAIGLRGDRRGRELGRLDRDDLERPCPVLPLGVLDLGDLVGEGGDPGVRELLRLEGRAGPGGDLDQHGVDRLLDLDVADEGGRGGLEAELVDDVLRRGPALRDVDVRLGPGLGEAVADRGERGVVVEAGADEAVRVRGVHLGLRDAERQGRRGRGDGQQQHTEPVRTKDAQVVGQFHGEAP